MVLVLWLVMGAALGAHATSTTKHHTAWARAVLNELEEEVPLEDITLDELLKCGDAIEAYEPGTPCPRDAILAACPCSDESECLELLAMMKDQMPRRMRPKAEALATACSPAAGDDNPLAGVSLDALIKCGDVVNGYTVGDPCPRDDLLARCPCVDEASCVKLLTVVRNQMPQRMQPKADALVEVCVQHNDDNKGGHEDSENNGSDGNTKEAQEWFTTRGKQRSLKELMGVMMGGDDVGQHSPLYLPLLFRTDPGGLIEGRPHMHHHNQPFGPFHNLPDSGFPMLTRMLWIAVRYGYSKDVHYQGLAEDKTTRLAPESTHVIEHVTAVKGQQGAEADAQAGLVFPDMSLRVGPTQEHPSVWYCERIYGKEFCDPDGTEFVHVTLRAMQLFNDLTTPPLDDLINMRQRTNVVDCRFPFRNVGTVTIPVSEGTCIMLRALVRVGFAKRLLRVLHPGKRFLFVFHGISYGGALAQASALLFQKTLKLVESKLPVPLDDVRSTLLLFGSPRVGDMQFKRQVEESNIHADHFAMFSYLGPYDNKPVQLVYDPIGFWPKSLHPVGNQYSLIFHEQQTEDGLRAVTDVHHDVFYSPVDPFVVALNGIGERLVADTDTTSFNCLHEFPRYHAFFEQRPSSGWCGARPLDKDTSLHQSG